MNHKKIYKDLMQRAKNREINSGSYYEKHHIIPDFMFLERKRSGPNGHILGDPNNKNNIVKLTAREHLISHLLLFKILKGTHYEYSAGSSLQFFTNKVINKHPRSKHINLNRKYEWARLKGIESISKARKDTFPVKDSVTNKIIGSFNRNHPNILSGKWVHHSKGITLSEDHKEKISKAGTGKNNPRYLNISNEKIIERYIEISKKLNKIPSMPFFKKWHNKKYNQKIPHIRSKYRFNYGKELYPILERELEMKFDKYQKWSRKLNVEDFI